jgi:hypothetical protein
MKDIFDGLLSQLVWLRLPYDTVGKYVFKNIAIIDTEQTEEDIKDEKLI